METYYKRTKDERNNEKNPQYQLNQSNEYQNKKFRDDGMDKVKKDLWNRWKLRWWWLNKASELD